jgi:hypothetical protein
MRGRIHDATTGTPVIVDDLTGHLACFEETSHCRWEWSGAGSRCDELLPRIRKPLEEEFGLPAAEHQGKTPQGRILIATWAFRGGLTARCEEGLAAGAAGGRSETQLEISPLPTHSFLENDLTVEAEPTIRVRHRRTADAGAK